MDTKKYRVWYKKKEKKLLEQNPAVKSVSGKRVIYTDEFREKALQEYATGKTANQIFADAELDVAMLSKQSDYAYIFYYYRENKYI